MHPNLAKLSSTENRRMTVLQPNNRIIYMLQDIKNNGGPGYKYITVEEDEVANVVYCNNTLVHLANEQIPKGFAVS